MSARNILSSTEYSNIQAIERKTRNTLTSNEISRAKKYLEKIEKKRKLNRMKQRRKNIQNRINRRNHTVKEKNICTTI